MIWKEISIGEIGQVITGNTPPRKNPEFYGNAYKFIKPTDMDIGNRYTPVTEDFYSEIAYEKYIKSLIPPLSTCVVTIGSIGQKMTLTDSYSFINQAVNAVIPNTENFDPFFIFYALKNILHKVKSADTGASSGRENVSKSNFMSLKLDVPTNIETQKKIGSVLSSFDDLIENNIKRIKLLEETAQNIYKEWFVNYRFPNYEHTEFNKESGEPNEFEKCRLSSIIDIQGGTQPPKLEWKEFYEEGYVRMVQIRDYYTDSHIAFVKESTKLRRCVKDDIMIARYGASVGRICWGLEGAYNVALVKIIPVKKEYNSYLRWYLKSDFFQSTLLGMTQRTAQDGFNKETFNAIWLIKPNHKLLIQFMEIETPIFFQIEKLKEQVSRLKEGRDILLPRLMNRMIEV